MLLKRFAQFFLIYGLGIAGLMTVKYAADLSDYVIPSLGELLDMVCREGIRYLGDVMNTLGVAVAGQAISVFLALSVGITGCRAGWFGSFVRVAAYNIQAYPIVALAPIIFILLGDGFLTRLVIAAMICYFPLLLTTIGILTAPVTEMEHFYRVTGRMTRILEARIRAFENLSKLTAVLSGSATLAVAGAIVAEFIAAQSGIGYSIRVALYQSSMARVLTALFYIGVVLSIYQGLLEWAGEKTRRRWSDL
ncbi:MAG: ABC transporter permease [Desulfococcus sp.]|nr:MAG: ABC transporter permease [Desulfococcus sp.]